MAKEEEPNKTETEKEEKPKKVAFLDSVNGAIFLYWILPVLCFAALSRFAVDTSAPSPPLKPPLPAAVKTNQVKPQQSSTGNTGATSAGATASAVGNAKAAGSLDPRLENKPASYQSIVRSIRNKRLDFDTVSLPASVRPSSTTSQAPQVSPTTGSTLDKPKTSPTPRQETSTASQRSSQSDPARAQLASAIEEYRSMYQADRSNLLTAIVFADSLRMYDVQYHDGGSHQEEAIKTYQHALQLAKDQRQAMIDRGEPTNVALDGNTRPHEQMMMDYSQRSVDAILCALHTNLGKTYYMANMFSKADTSYSNALEIDPFYLDAVASRGSTRIILGEYKGAAQDFVTVIELDSQRRFLDVFTGLARVLQAREDVVPQGWEPMIATVNDIIPKLEEQQRFMTAQEGKTLVSNSLARLYHVLYDYHDAKTKDTDAAWKSLEKSYEHKMNALPPWNTGFEAQKVQATKQIFRQGFWPEAGSKSKAPIFIIGFVRSGSTLLERVLDAHPDIVGTGENSVFNGQLESIRNKIVEVSVLANPSLLASTIQDLADDVVYEMTERWHMVAAGEDRATGQENPTRMVDKMLTNYYNVGFIHLLFPDALILHVARNPMDTLFSAFKHEFPPGTLDYTSAFDSLAELYHGYRDLIEHWDRELPGRVTHVRYEDMVHDMPGMARAIVHATGLEWDDGVLEFHKKKQAVNTLSTTQVRKGVYKDSLEYWRRYETELDPLVQLIGERTKWDLKTTLPTYTPPAPVEETEDASEL
eukprot:Nitzschia sp. Nitz4//scaffold12_size214221//26702//29169//NITZ4_001481-RA/size214221-augustus-gene-0.2-mRNA-1//1//CDS//3329534963//6665//frame0